MALISHRCVCGDLDFAHWSSNIGRGRCGNLRCKCRCQAFRDDGAGPEVVPTFTIEGQPAELIEPGRKWNDGIGVHSFTTCSCDACGELYRQEVSA